MDKKPMYQVNSQGAQKVEAPIKNNGKKGTGSVKRGTDLRSGK